MFDINKIQAAEATPQYQRKAEKAPARVVFSKNGKRLEISPQLAEELCLEEHIQIVFEKNSLWLGKCFSDEMPKYPLKKQSNGFVVVYNAKLIEEISKKMALDFTSRTSYSLYCSEVDSYQGTSVVHLTLTGGTQSC